MGVPQVLDDVPPLPQGPLLLAMLAYLLQALKHPFLSHCGVTMCTVYIVGKHQLHTCFYISKSPSNLPTPFPRLLLQLCRVRKITHDDCTEMLHTGWIHKFKTHDWHLLYSGTLVAYHLNKVNDISPDFISTGVSCIDSSSLLVCRPYGGCSILYRKSLSPFTSPLDSYSDHFCAVKPCNSNSFSFLLICVYMPNEHHQSSITDYLDVLREIQGFIESNPMSL